MRRVSFLKKRLLLHTALDKRKKQAYNTLVGLFWLTQNKLIRSKTMKQKRGIRRTETAIYSFYGCFPCCVLCCLSSCTVQSGKQRIPVAHLIVSISAVETAVFQCCGKRTLCRKSKWSNFVFWVQKLPKCFFLAVYTSYARLC